MPQELPESSKNQVVRAARFLHYGSKENLLRAVLEAKADMWFQWFDTDLAVLNCPPAIVFWRYSM